MKTSTELSVAGMCSLAGFSRAGYYRAQQPLPRSGDHAQSSTDDRNTVLAARSTNRREGHASCQSQCSLSTSCRMRRTLPK